MMKMIKEPKSVLEPVGAVDSVLTALAKIHVNQGAVISDPELVKILPFIMLKETERIVLQKMSSGYYPIPHIRRQRIENSGSLRMPFDFPAHFLTSLCEIYPSSGVDLASSSDFFASSVSSYSSRISSICFTADFISSISSCKFSSVAVPAYCCQEFIKFMPLAAGKDIEAYVLTTNWA